MTNRAIALPEVEDRGDRRCFKFYDTGASKEIWKCIEKGEDETNAETIYIGGDPIPMNEYGNRIECRGVEDEEQCWDDHGIDDPFVRGDL